MPTTKHDQCRTRLYHIWNGMKMRCLNPKNIGYKYYGGKGVSVDENWARDFNVFRDWAIANGYRDDLTLERIDSNGSYNPENCKWATRKEQQNNTSYNHTITYLGITRTMKQWSEVTGISYNALNNRCRRGWSVERMLTVPQNKYIKHTESRDDLSQISISTK